MLQHIVQLDFIFFTVHLILKIFITFQQIFIYYQFPIFNCSDKFLFTCDFSTIETFFDDIENNSNPDFFSSLIIYLSL